MFRSMVCALWLSCILLGSSLAAASMGDLSAPEIDQINTLLRGKIVALELVDGSTVKKAKKVVVESNFTYWQAKGKEQKIATEEISRITARSKSRGWIGLGAGAGIGIISAAQSSDSAAEDQVAAANADAIFFSTVALAAIGYGVDKAIPRKSTVVFESGSANPTAVSTEKTE